MPGVVDLELGLELFQFTSFCPFGLGAGWLSLL